MASALRFSSMSDGLSPSTFPDLSEQQLENIDLNPVGSRKRLRSPSPPIDPAAVDLDLPLKKKVKLLAQRSFAQALQPAPVSAQPPVLASPQSAAAAFQSPAPLLALQQSAAAAFQSPAPFSAIPPTPPPSPNSVVAAGSAQYDEYSDEELSAIFQSRLQIRSESAPLPSRPTNPVAAIREAASAEQVGVVHSQMIFPSIQ